MTCAELFKRAAACICTAVLLTGICACGDANSADKDAHSLDELELISMTYGCMDRSCSYLFTLKREEGEWLFDAECFVRDRTEPFSVTGVPVSDESVNELFGILEAHDTVTYAQSYRKPFSLDIFAQDQDTSDFCLSFADGSQYHAESAGDAQGELTEFFYRLAEDASR